MKKSFKKQIAIILVEIIKVIVKYLFPAVLGYIEGSEQVLTTFITGLL